MSAMLVVYLNQIFKPESTRCFESTVEISREDSIGTTGRPG